MKTFVVYGTAAMTASSLKSRLEVLLGLEFEARTGDYWGDYYKAGRSPNENLRILRNQADDEGDLPYDEFKDMPVILEVNCANEATLATIGNTIDGLVLLERTEV